ncbi:peptide ABC transporter permease [Mangrovactinospora gilvigrisea]|uniref:Peptide ABC transporter permease n=1 Tax=Mangrovactinospora gilvigrisea TaxID=1428644 RepID=A0A1J7BJ20_9ACTN|nr:ABC transporter permease [Mangrovactinospora gilvigrisea]OIV38671.1 peptide ABC transporter permease [Mangrovactinospora gilvigrisea]
MLRYIARRLIGMAVVLLITGAVTYVIFYWMPSDPARLSCGKPCTPETLHQVRAYMGLNQPIWEQYWHFLEGLVGGRSFGIGQAAAQCPAPCLGYSFHQSMPVRTMIGTAFPVTVSITVGAAALWLVFGVATGMISAVKRGTWWDRGATLLSLTGVATPTYLVGLLGILLLGFQWRLVPVNGYANFTDGIGPWASHLILPWAVLAFVNAAVYARLTRSQLLEVFGEDYITTARAKGLPERIVIGKHSLRAALTPIATMFGMDIGLLLGGAIITEKVFSMQGLGYLLLQGVGQLDLPVVVGVTLFSAFFVVAANLLVDILYGYLDPRVSLA